MWRGEYANPQDMSDRARDGWMYALGLYGLGNLANGIWMLASTCSWWMGPPSA